MEFSTYLQVDDGYELVEGNNSPPVVHSTVGHLTYQQPVQSQQLSHLEIELSNRGVIINGDLAGDQDAAEVVREAMNHWYMAQKRQQEQEYARLNPKPAIVQQDWLVGLGAVITCLFLSYFGIQMFSNRIPTNPVPAGNYYQQLR